VLNEISRVIRERPAAEGEQIALPAQVFNRPPAPNERAGLASGDDTRVSQAVIPKPKPANDESATSSSIGPMVELGQLEESTSTETDQSAVDRLSLIRCCSVERGRAFQNISTFRLDSEDSLVDWLIASWLSGYESKVGRIERIAGESPR
jgi:hypothetical protein